MKAAHAVNGDILFWNKLLGIAIMELICYNISPVTKPVWHGCSYGGSTLLWKRTEESVREWDGDTKWETADWTLANLRFFFCERFPAVNLQCLCELLLKPNPLAWPRSFISAGLQGGILLLDGLPVLSILWNMKDRRRLKCIRFIWMEQESSWNSKQWLDGK